jgi:hypothetical protein
VGGAKMIEGVVVNGQVCVPNPIAARDSLSEDDR